MKKLSLISIIIFIMIMAFSVNAYAATTGKIELSSTKTSYNKGDKVVVKAKMVNIKSDEGIIALSGVLSVDSSKLKVVEMKSLGNWSNPSYNEESGTFVTDRSSLTSSDEDLFEIVLEVISSDTTNAEVKVTNVQASGGEGIGNLGEAVINLELNPTTGIPGGSGSGTGDTTNPNITKPTDSNTDTTNTNISKVNSSNTNSSNTLKENKVSKTDTTSNKMLPKTGLQDSKIVVIGILVGMAICIVFYVKIKEI